MNLVKCILTANDCYKTGRYITPKGVMVHSTGANNPKVARYVQPLESDSDYQAIIDKIGFNRNHNDWNCSGTSACVHGFIGKFADGSIGTVQALPWNMRGWHAGTGTSGGSANNTHISFEICEDDLSDADYFNKVYKEAVELTAMLCKTYGLDPMKDGVVICHSEGYSRGVASNHSDVMHWFPKHGKSMDTFRSDVKAQMGGASVDPAPEQPDTPTTNVNYKVKVTPAEGLNCRKDAGTGYAIVKAYVCGTVLTITKEKNGWGYTGDGWVSLDYTTKVASSNTTSVNYKAKVNATDGLNCRKGAGTNYAVVKAYTYNTVLTITKEQNGWGYTGDGWVSLQYVTKITEQKPSYTNVNYKVRVNASAGLNCRKEPNTSSAVVKAFTNGTELTVTKEQNGWGYVGSGWISLQYTTKVTSFKSYKVKVTATKGLNYRSGAGTGYKKLGAYTYGTTLTISKESGGWGYTGKGWVSLQYTKKI